MPINGTDSAFYLTNITLDEAIRKAEEIIAKLQQMRQGLLHDLLTRGIDDEGELRDPEQCPVSTAATTAFLSTRPQPQPPPVAGRWGRDWGDTLVGFSLGWTPA